MQPNMTQQNLIKRKQWSDVP